MIKIIRLLHQKVIVNLAFLAAASFLSWPGLAQSVSATQEPGVFEAQKFEVVNYYQAVGTIRPRQEPVISAQVQARVLEVLVAPGDMVEAGDLLIRLEQDEFKSRLKQARLDLEGAKASIQRIRREIDAAGALLDEAGPQFERMQRLHSRDVATRQELDRAASEYFQARAGHEQALMSLQEAASSRDALQEKINELMVVLDYTRIRAPAGAQVVRTMADPGDLAAPDRPLLKLQTRHLLRLEARVPERLISRVSPGDVFEIQVDALDIKISGRVSEIDPAAEVDSRSFLIKLCIEDSPDLYPGMFARMLIPVETEEVLMIPEEAVRRIGQLETVQILRDGRRQTRHVRLGPEHNGRVQVLSGLSVQDRVVLNPSIP
ncbi:efflux RND transporter periplasmic adaptor subunit [Desulfonatronospira sp.]|uniref:efflux RND transporter periplasmic adaptor subunit n=1 Tax=Desulfonatronospira sp. TaxID=1962951 RepID=UPI0025BC6A19|nr:efflux RND transporter periplasmic adaptor subunit [Desulfonatronospira sp.]